MVADPQGGEHQGRINPLVVPYRTTTTEARQAWGLFLPEPQRLRNDVRTLATIFATQPGSKGRYRPGQGGCPKPKSSDITILAGTDRDWPGGRLLRRD